MRRYVDMVCMTSISTVYERMSDVYEGWVCVCVWVDVWVCV